MNLQDMLHSGVAAMRKESFDKSDQLSLGELMDKIKPLINDEIKVVYDFCGAFPTSIDSWRGSYDELSLNHINGEDTAKKLTGNEFHALLEQAIGATYQGYKGGEYIMSKDTPVWVDSYGKYTETAIVGVFNNGYEVVLVTGRRDF